MSNALAETIFRDLFVFEDETNPRTSKVNLIYPPTVLDQVFDHTSPTRRNLREILEDLRYEIITGGIGNIVFPVTTVNGRDGDVVISKFEIGLGNVDNTKDIDKPLSGPQLLAVQNMLNSFDFHVNLDDLYNHILDKNNPHGISLDQLNVENQLSNLIANMIGLHNLSNGGDTHFDIRRNIDKLWNLVDAYVQQTSIKFDDVWTQFNAHLIDGLAHHDTFMTKENISNKVMVFNKLIDNTHTKYPSNKAVIDYIEERLEEFRFTLTDGQKWIDSIRVITNTDDLPIANESTFRRVYILRNGSGSQNSIAVCKKNFDSTYSWEVTDIGSISKFNPDQFVDSLDGLSIKVDNVYNQMLETAKEDLVTDYYTKQEVDNTFLKAVKILPGTMDGHIRYYINGDAATMTTDIPIPGLRDLAYQEWISEENILDNAVHNRHILPTSITTEKIADLNVTHEKVPCAMGKVLGNTDDVGHVHEIPLMALADYLRPLIGGWPDPYTPGGNPWLNNIRDMLVSPHLWEPDVEMDLRDGSFARRFVGTTSAIPNFVLTSILSTELTTNTCKLVDSGGTWTMSSIDGTQSIISGSNILHHTYSTIVMDKYNLRFMSLSIDNRLDAPYDLWLRYIKL